MPKLKTHSGTKDRIKVSKNGKMQRSHAGKSHLLSKKSASRKRTFAGTKALTGRQAENIKLKLGL